jgi:hypothetical protein
MRSVNLIIVLLQVFLTWRQFCSIQIGGWQLAGGISVLDMEKEDKAGPTCKSCMQLSS